MRIWFLLLPALMLAAPPATKRSGHADTLHGVRVEDPYRWLEDVDSAETKAWVQSQVAYSRAHLDKIPGRAALRQRIEKLMDYRSSYPRVLLRGGRLFFMRKESAQNQPILFVQEKDGKQRELLNPNTLSKEGIAAISTWAPSGDGKYVAYGVSKAGSDWQEWRIRDVVSGVDRTDLLEWIKFSTPEWSADNSGIYYSTYPKPEGQNVLTASNYYNKVYYHRLGTKQSEDQLIYERKDQPEWGFGSWTSEDGAYLLIDARKGTATEHLVFHKDLKAKDGKVSPLITEFTGDFEALGNRGSVVYFRTTDGAPKGRIVAIDVKNPAKANWKTIVGENADVLENAAWSAGHLFCVYIHDVKSAVRIHALDGKFVREVKLPGVGMAMWSEQSANEKRQYYGFTGFTSPFAVYSYDFDKDLSTPLSTDKLPFDGSQFETKQVFYPSKDGTRIPMFLSMKKGLKPGKDTPALLYGYGGFNIALKPAFSAMYVAWMEMGGVLAIANLRGGSEYGEAWHKAGMKQTKQNVFDDFISAGEWLVKNNYTSSAKLAILGGSNGGLLVGACLNQQPSLFGAAIPMVGVMDMLRFHKFTIGRAWTSDYGSPDDPKDFQTLLKYSPLHNIKRGTKYPPVMVMTADHDDRVVPAHSFKYGAQMQYAQEGPAPILLRIETSAGHGAGKPKSKTLDEWTDMLSFLRESLKM